MPEDADIICKKSVSENGMEESGDGGEGFTGLQSVL